MTVVVDEDHLLRLVVLDDCASAVDRLRRDFAGADDAVLSAGERRFAIVEAPLHRQFLRDMIAGAATGDLILAALDIATGLSEGVRRALYLLSLLGARRVVVAVNQAEGAAGDVGRFSAVAQDIRNYLQQVGAAAIAIVPVVARDGGMIGKRADALSWYHGPTLLEALERFEPEAASFEVLPLRFTVQDIYKFDERRIVAGRVESGVLRVGDTLTFAPRGVTARVASLEDWNQPLRRVAAIAGDTVGITFEGRAFVERGDIGAPAAEPIRLATRLAVRVFWLAREPLRIGRSIGLHIGGRDYRVTVRAIEGVIDTATLERRDADGVAANEIAELVLEASEPVPVDRYEGLPRTGRGLLIEGSEALGGAIVLDIAEAAPRPSGQALPAGVARDERERRHRHRGGVLWLSGLSGAGKSTLAFGLERVLFDGGMHAVALDGEAVRRGLSRDLGFNLLDRAENVRRVAETARLLAEAGHIVIVSITAPRRVDRDRARAIIGDGFANIHVHADLALCEARDPKGLYARARRGGIRGDGLDTAYEPPEAPDLKIDTGVLDIAESVDRLVGFVDSRFHDPRIDLRLVEPEWSV